MTDLYNRRLGITVCVKNTMSIPYTALLHTWRHASEPIIVSDCNRDTAMEVNMKEAYYLINIQLNKGMVRFKQCYVNIVYDRITW